MCVCACALVCVREGGAIMCKVRAPLAWAFGLAAGQGQGVRPGMGRLLGACCRG